MIFKLAWRNIWRQPRRTWLNASGIMLVTGIMIFLPSFQQGSYRAMIRASVNVLDGYGQIQRSDYMEEPSIRNGFLVTDELKTWLEERLPDDSYTERASGFALLSSEERSLGAQIVGVDPAKDPNLSAVPRNIAEGRYLNGGAEILLGEGLARNLRAKVGDRITIIGTGRDGTLAADALEVVGVFHSGMPDLDRNLAEMPIGRFDATFSMDGERHAIVLSEAGASQLAGLAMPEDDLVFRTWRELQPGLLQAIRIDIGSAVMMYLILVIVICFSLLNSVLISTLERTREFGMMLALGTNPALLSKVVWVENSLILGLGLLGGCGLGVGVTAWLERTGIRFEKSEEIFAQYGLSSTLYPYMSELTLLLGPCVIAVLALALGLYPSVRVRRLTAIEAMKAV